VTIIPQYLIWAKLGFIDTYVPLILPAFFGGGAFYIFLLRQFFLGIPVDLDEAAKIDGAGNIWIFSRIIIPLAKSAVMVICLFIFLGCWNDFFGPLIYLNSQKRFTLALGLLQFRGQYGTRWNWVMAASTIVVIPCSIMYIFTQRKLIEGIALTGLKT
jgi:multiple sugar transport system permease protein